jgi:hypothetical protein
VRVAWGRMRVRVFSGPWAEEFRKAYAQAPDDLTRGILFDGVITEAEVSESTEDYRKCLVGQGFVALLTCGGVGDTLFGWE